MTKTIDPDMVQMVNDARDRLLPVFKGMPEKFLDYVFETVILSLAESLEIFTKAVEDGDEVRKVKAMCKIMQNKIMAFALQHVKWELFIESDVDVESKQKIDEAMDDASHEITQVIQRMVDEATPGR